MSGAYLESCKGKAAAVLAVVFLAGAATGALGLKVLQRQTVPADASTLVEHRHEPSLAVERLHSELNLNTEQVSAVQEILDECIMIEADLLQQLALTRTDGRERIMQILNEQQQDRFRGLLSEVSTQSAE